MARLALLLTIVLLTRLAGLPAMAAPHTPHIRLSPDKAGYWRADYTLDHPASALRFVRPSDGRRATRVRILDPGFVWARDGEDDLIIRADGTSFDSVSITEATSYDLPGKDYLSFAQFGDGGLLIYSGRFHACAEHCPLDASGNHAPFPMTIDPGAAQFRDGNRIIAHGRISDEPVSFHDIADGTKIYVGSGRIRKNAHYLSVIDEALPDIVRRDLDELFPVLMDYFAERLGPPAHTPMLFVSYNVPGRIVRGSSIKGGALPQQVFMHFEGARTASFAYSRDFRPFIAWFFAHEAAHLHQFGREYQRHQADSWIHEGGAEALAALALGEIGIDPRDIAERISEKAGKCADALSHGPLSRAHERQDFDAFYTCGLTAFLSLHDALAKTDSDLFAFWRAFSAAVMQGAPWTRDSLLRAAREAGIDQETLDFLTTLTGDDAAPPTRAVRHFGDTETVRNIISTQRMNRK